jgi:hypothetical protein
MTRVVWNEVALNDLLAGPNGAVVKDLARRGLNVETQAKLNCPVDGGRLRASIRHEIDVDARGPVARIGSNVSYARYVEEGTPPHRIVARNKKALHWPGARHPVLAVNHPGTRARPYLRPALAAAAL